MTTEYQPPYKRCGICGELFRNPDDGRHYIDIWGEPQVRNHYHISISQVGTVYILHLSPARILWSCDNGSKNRVLDHYIGWTSRTNPLIRVREHNARPDELVWTERGSMLDERRIKAVYPKICPGCK